MPRPFTRQAPLKEPRDKQTQVAVCRGHAFGMPWTIFDNESYKDGEEAASFPAPPQCWVFVLFNCTLVGEGVAELLIEMQCLWLRCFTFPSPL